MPNLLEPINYGAYTHATSIIYNTVSTEDGWIIEARFPPSVPSSDRSSVLKWFEEYSDNIHKTYPLWVTSFAINEDWYRLEIKRTNNVRELLNNLQEKAAATWEEDPTYGR